MKRSPALTVLVSFPARGGPSELLDVMVAP